MAGDTVGSLAVEDAVGAAMDESDSRVGEVAMLSVAMSGATSSTKIPIVAGTGSTLCKGRGGWRGREGGREGGRWG